MGKWLRECKGSEKLVAGCVGGSFACVACSTLCSYLVQLLRLLLLAVAAAAGSLACRCLPGGASLARVPAVASCPPRRLLAARVTVRKAQQPTCPCHPLPSETTAGCRPCGVRPRSCGAGRHDKVWDELSVGVER